MKEAINNTGPLRLLLVEENDLMRRTVAMTASEYFYAVTHEAESRDEAMMCLRRTEFDGAFLSVAVDSDASDRLNMDVMRAIRSGQTMSNTRTPVIALVNQCTQQCVDTLRAEGAQHVLIKPFRARTLLEMMVSAFAARVR